MTATVHWVARAGEIDPLLWDACFPPPLEGRWWYSALEQAGLDEQFTFLYGVIDDGNRPVGIAPAFIMDFPVDLVAPDALVPVVKWLGRIWPRIARPRTLFVGSPCADEGTVGMLPGADRTEALRALHRALEAEARQRGTDLIVWKDFRGLEPMPGLFPVVSFPGTVVALPGSKDAYFAALKGSRRHVLKKKLRRSGERVELEVEVVQRPDAATLDGVFALFWQTYQKATTRFERLNRRFFEAIAAASCARFVLLRLPGGELVAFMLCFDLGATVINKFIGIDYRRPREWLLYFRLWEAALDWALARGASEIQSGQTGYAPKIETGHRLVPLTSYCAHRNRLVHALARRAARGIDWTTLDNDLARFVRAHPQATAGSSSPAR